MYKHVVLFDDDQDDAELFKEALEEINTEIKFTYFNDELEGIENICKKGIVKPDIIFLDLNMPSLSGWDCLRMLKSNVNTKPVHVIMYTTSSQKREKEIARDLGASGFITKPTDYKELIRILEGVLSASADQLEKHTMG